MGRTHALLKTAILYGFFFPLQGERVLEKRATRPREDRPRGGYQLPDKRRGPRRVQFRRTKSNQQAFGCMRTHYTVREGGKKLCIVRALGGLRQRYPARFGLGREANLPLFRWEDSKQVKREEVQKTVGLPAQRFRSHSLRIGGASALLHAAGQFDLVKRYGRWSSDAVHSYLHDSAEQAQGLAQKMSNDRSSVQYT